VCGSPSEKMGICNICKKIPPPYHALRSWGLYSGPLRNAILKLKYQRDIGLGEILAQNLISLFLTFDWRIDLCIPVPLSRKRNSERGYNQSALLARPVALRCRIPFSTNALTRNRDTPTQVTLSADERRNNVAKAFTANPNLVYNKVVLVIDDITTTGATMISCSETILEAGARFVYGLTLARTAHVSS
jgi:competence protein ComFC